MNKTLAMLGVMAALSPEVMTGITTPRFSKKDWKPKFTEEELVEIRSLPKRERKKRVAELRAKYQNSAQSESEAGE